MLIAFALVAIVAMNGQVYSDDLNMSLYHTSEQIDHELSLLINGKCKGKISETSFKNSQTAKSFDHETVEKYSLLKYYSIKTASGGKKKLRVFLLSGEHARELIAVELILYFIKFLCSESHVAK